MSNVTHPKGMQTPTATTTAGGENRQDAQKRYRREGVLWVFGFIVFLLSCVFVHTHPQPFTFELATTEALQGAHFPGWVVSVLDFPSMLNQPIPSAIALGVWFFGILILGFVNMRRGKAVIQWVQAAVFLLLTVIASAGINVLADDIVGRPRPSPSEGPIHVHDMVPFPSYPSGHTEHDVAYYGFLLYLSFTKGVREWRYRWILLPLQVYAVYDILSIGISRVLEGDHWLLDVLGGYLEGALLLFLFIFLYRWITGKVVEHHEKKRAEKAGFV